MSLAIVDAAAARAAVVLPHAQSMTAAGMQQALQTAGNSNTADSTTGLADMQPHMVVEMTDSAQSMPSPSTAACCVALGKVRGQAVVVLPSLSHLNSLHAHTSTTFTL